MLKALALSIAPLAFLAAPALAADTAPKREPPAVTSPKPAKPASRPNDKLICEREMVLGSFMTRRVCKTQEQIDEDRRGAESLENQRQLLSNRLPRP